MTEQRRRFRSEKKPPIKEKGDRILNYLITIVVILIFVVAGFIFSGNGEKKVAVDKPNEVIKEQPTEKEVNEEKEQPKKEDETSEETSDAELAKEADEAGEDLTTVEKLKKSETAKVTEVNDAIVLEAIEDESWQPYETKQKTNIGKNHVSSYDTNSVDWNEKIAAISAITGLQADNMTVWYIKNNGGPETSIGTVSSKDQREKYRVSLVWVSNKGWKAVKVEQLKEINGAY